uniref:Retrovirus-related Pol polyprotein from transposon TNT 1-94 n=1 Tax=Tanacetum cinerariifolium TaxID=118510 RepID=A0A6L2JQ65_TANCI|nr:retrovirus-related Pol polyprotein from transposon TNT 1-94 [Tanacetum cinerariifolium]
MTIDTNVTTLVNVTGAPVTNTVSNHVEKPEKFSRQNFKRWQQKMFFYLTTLNLTRFLKEIAPQAKPSREGQPFNAQAMQVMEAWKHSNFLFHNYVLSEKGMSVEDFAVHLRIEEDNKLAQKNTYTPDSAKANMVEHKFQGTCYNYDQPGHRTANCKMPKQEVLTIVVVGLIMGQPVMCALIRGEGDVIMKMTSDKELKLTNVLYVLEIRKNLVSDCKDEVIDKFVLYKTEVENQLGKKIKVVRSDKRREYVSPFADLCAKHGIRHEFNAPYSPQQNSTAERKNHTLREMVNAMLLSSGVSQDMLEEAILTATYLLNKILHKEKEETLITLKLTKYRK